MTGDRKTHHRSMGLILSTVLPYRLRAARSEVAGERRPVPYPADTSRTTHLSAQITFQSLDNERSAGRFSGPSALLDDSDDAIRIELCLSFYEPGFCFRLDFERTLLQ